MSRRPDWKLVFLLVIASIAVAVPAGADLVYGTVFVDDKPRPNAAFTIKVDKNTITVKTDAAGRYRTVLKPGLYDAQFPVQDPRWHARVHSDEYPVKQDLRFVH